MKWQALILVAGAATLATAAHAAVTFEYLFDGGFPLAVSYDGSVIAGNSTYDYGAFRWTSATGFVPLGRASAPVVGTSGGTPGLSADGRIVAATIHSDDSTFVTAGVWSEADGWTQIAPPVPPDGGIMDANLADVWGLSGDGHVVVGLYWRPGSQGASAHAYRWTPEGGMVDLGVPGRSSRANGASFDGSVIAGWQHHPSYGYRQPCVWRGTTQTLLGDIDANGEAQACSPNGEWVVGFQINPVTHIREATRWHWDGSAWSATQFLGSVPGTFPSQGIAAAKAVSSDGSIVIGYSSPYGDPYYTTGFLWTAATGCVDLEFWLADHDVFMDADFDMRSLTCMTPDGQTLVGYGLKTTVPVAYRAFVVHWDHAYLAVAPPEPRPTATLAASPNPARAGTTLEFDLARAGSAALDVLDLGGRVVRRVWSGPLAAGRQRLAWDGRDDAGTKVAPGLYFTRLVGEGTTVRGRVTVLD